MNKNVYILIALLVVLLIAAYYVLKMPGESDSNSEHSTIFLSVDSAATDGIEIKSPSTDVKLERKGNTWYVTAPVHYRADQKSVEDAIHQCKILSVLNLVSDKPEKFSIFQVDSTGTRISLFQGGKATSAFIVGKTSPNFTDSYVRKAGANQVMLARGVLEYTFNRQLKEWRDRTIISVSREEIKSIAVQNGKDSYQLMLRDSVWMLDGKRVKLSAVNDLIASLSNFQADDFLDSAVTPAPKTSSRISFAGLQLRFAENGKDGYYVQSSTSSQWYIVEGWHAKEIFKSRKDLLE